MGGKEMTHTMTRTYVELVVSEAAYNEIAQKLRNADYSHVFIGDGCHEVMDLNGIALKKENKND